jgi:purine-cytosine permease-like protein
MSINDNFDVNPAPAEKLETDFYNAPTASASASASLRRSSLRRLSIASVVETVDSKVHAYERERVPEDRFKGWLSFLGLFISRHTAGTEFAIGPLFVANGATAIDVIVGLAIGNLLATLSWRFVCAPLAVKNRFTSYYNMERVVGRRVVLVYDALCSIILAGLAGAMFTVSATAFATIFNVQPPGLSDLLPNSWAFVFICIICGIVTVVVAAVGFSVVTTFGDLMTPVLISGIIYLFVKSLQDLGIGQDGCRLWCVFTEDVFTVS